MRRERTGAPVLELSVGRTCLFRATTPGIPMPNRTPDHLRSIALRAEGLAIRASNPTLHRSWLELADLYERLAQQVETLESQRARLDALRARHPIHPGSA